MSAPNRYDSEVFFPVPDTTERIKILATIVHTKWQENFRGEGQLAGLFLCEGDEGRFKLWANIPGPIIDAIEEESKTNKLATIAGSFVEFHATVSRSKKDDCFGFFKRPTRAKVLTFGANRRESVG